MRAQYLVGCDGGRSLVRKAFPGSSLPPRDVRLSEIYRAVALSNSSIVCAAIGLLK
jgi:2-polyprenyl-6-methoxyphenol hydroxylase-like FAD-dependent oxidoreductase